MVIELSIIPKVLKRRLTLLPPQYEKIMRAARLNGTIGSVMAVRTANLCCFISRIRILPSSLGHIFREFEAVFPFDVQYPRCWSIRDRRHGTAQGQRELRGVYV